MTNSVGDQNLNQRQRQEVNPILVMAISIVESVLVAINHVIAIVTIVTIAIVVVNIIAIENTEIVIIRLKNKAEVSWNNIETEQIKNKNLKRNKDPIKKRTI